MIHKDYKKRPTLSKILKLLPNEIELELKWQISENNLLKQEISNLEKKINQNKTSFQKLIKKISF